MSSPILAIFATLCALGVIAILWKRRIRLTLPAKLTAIIAILLLVLAAGSPHFLLPSRGRVIVMADFSDSTRGAGYRDGRLVDQLSRQFHAEVIRLDSTDGFTTFNPPAVDAILLLSDGQFDLPSFAPPTYPIIDPALADVKDASLQNLEYRNREIVATVNNSGDATTLTFSSNPARLREVPRGVTSIAELSGNSEAITARIDSVDLWPENNTLTIAPSPPLHVERWWVGSAPPDESWRGKSVSDLPDDPGAYLRPSVIVLDAVDSQALSPAQTARLEQYVRDLGGAIVLHGLPKQLSFSPLSDSPPEPRRRWIVLCDVSGSMAQSPGDVRRIDKAVSAIRLLLPTLPEKDRVDVGGFARDLNWWTTGKSVAETARVDFVPRNLSPSGPTNLQLVLQKLPQDASDALPSAILLISDAEADFPDLDAIIASLKSVKAQVFLLQVGDMLSPAMDRLIRETGGERLPAGDGDWNDKLQSLAAAASREGVLQGEIHFSINARGYRASHLRESWLKDEAKILASAQVNGRAMPVAAEWMTGAGKVIAIAVDSRETAADLALAIASPPADPRIIVSVETGEKIRIRINAKNERGYLNGLPLFAQLGDDSRVKVPQVAPGEYELSLLSPHSPSLLTIYHDSRVMDRIALSGRYPREFSRIGLNRDNLEALARQTGGNVIEAGEVSSVNFLRRESRDISPLLLTLACVCMGILLWQWKSGRLLA